MLQQIFTVKLLKKIACGTLASALILSGVGCGDKDTTSDKAQIGGGKHDVIGSEDAMSFEALGLPEVKITGDKVTYLNWHGTQKLEDPKESFYQINLLLKQYYNCELEFITTTYEELPTKAAQMVLSGQSPDIIFYKSQDNPGFIYNNIVQPYDDYVDLENKWIKPYRMDDYTVNGKHYFLGGVINNGRVYYWKQKFIDIGEKTPLQLYKEGKWTWEKFKELAKKLTVDENNDGTPEVYGCNLDALYTYTACGQDIVKFNEDGSIVNNMKSASISKAMNLLNWVGKTGENVKGGSFDEGTAVMFWEEAWRASSYGEFYKAGTVEYAPSPKMDGADKYYVPGRISTDWLAAGAPNPGGAMAYFACSRLLYDDNNEIGKKYSEITTEIVGYTDEMKALNKELSDNTKFTPVPTRMEGVGNWDGAGMWKMLDEVGKWGTPWTTCLETYYPVLQAEIDRANQDRLSKK